MTASLSLPVLAAFAALLAAPALVRADEAPGKAAAQVLYDEAVRLMASGNLAEACKKLEDSSRLFDGLGTRARLAECYERSGRLASAWTTFRGALSAAETRADPRAAELRARVASLEPRLSRLRIDVPVPSRVPGLTVSLGGREIPEGTWGSSLPVDGGTHLIEAVTPGGGRWTTSVRVRDEKDEVAVRIEPPAPASAPAPPAPSASVPPPAPTAAPAPVAPGPPEPAAKEAAIPRRTLGLALGGVGLVGVAVGSFFGWKTIEKKNASNADGHCNASNVCDRVGTELRNEGKSAATLATVFMGIGAASLVGGAVLFLTAPPEETRQGKVRLAPLVGQDGGGLSLRGAW